LDNRKSASGHDVKKECQLACGLLFRFARVTRYNHFGSGFSAFGDCHIGRSL
jgi:hypothetical protein